MRWIRQKKKSNAVWILSLFFGGIFVMAPLAENKIIRLPAPNLTGSVSVEKAIAERRSIRQFADDSLSLEIVSQMLWAAQGITNGDRRRAAPSAGATYPLKIYLVANRVEGLKSGLYHYLVDSHGLEVIKIQDLGNPLREAALGQSMIEKAAFNIVIAADYQRTTARYGARGGRYVHIEVGHAGQNIYLQAEALGLGTVAVGAFNDQKVQDLLEIKEEVLYIMPIGKPVR
jgi:SagB-type dehydrogenase family enzyme